jgi:hypothetical protein
MIASPGARSPRATRSARQPFRCTAPRRAGDSNDTEYGHADDFPGTADGWSCTSPPGSMRHPNFHTTGDTTPALLLFIVCR